MLLLIVLLFPLVAAVLTYFSGKKAAFWVSLILSKLNFWITLYLYFQLRSSASSIISFSHSWMSFPKIDFALQCDGLALVLIFLTNLLIPTIIYSTADKRPKNQAVLYSLILFMQFALIGVFMAADGFLYYIFWELALLPIFFISWLWGEGEDKAFRSKAIFKFFLYTLAGSLFMLLGFIFLYTKSGSFLLSDLYKLQLSDIEQCWVFMAFFVAFAIKIPIFPLHTWQPNTYKEAPFFGSMLLSGIMLKMGLYSLLRWLMPVVPHGFVCWTPLVIVLCVIGIIYGSIIAIKQDDLKKLIAYSSFAHVGLIAAGIFSFSIEGMQGAVVQMLAHGINVVGLFFAAEIIFRRLGTHSIAQLGGIKNVAPKFAAVFLLVVLAAVGLPGTNSFIGEFLLLYGTFTYNTILSVIAGLTIILGAVYMLRMYQLSMLGQTNGRTAVFPDLTWSELVLFLGIIFMIFVFGIYPKPIMDLVQPVLENILAISSR